MRPAVLGLAGGLVCGGLGCALKPVKELLDYSLVASGVFLKLRVHLKPATLGFRNGQVWNCYASVHISI